MRRRQLVTLRKSCARRWQGNVKLRKLHHKASYNWGNFFYFRYLHYYNRYMNHMQSLKFEHKLYNCIKEKMEEMQQHNMSWIEVCVSLYQGLANEIIWLLVVFRFNSWNEPSTSWFSADKPLCAHTCLRTTYVRIISHWYSRRIKRTWNQPRKNCPNIWSVILRRRIWPTSSRKSKTNTGKSEFNATHHFHSIVCIGVERWLIWNDSLFL